MKNVKFETKKFYKFKTFLYKSNTTLFLHCHNSVVQANCLCKTDLNKIMTRQSCSVYVVKSHQFALSFIQLYVLCYMKQNRSRIMFKYIVSLFSFEMESLNISNAKTSERKQMFHFISTLVKGMLSEYSCLFVRG